jgi:hypothetical protein
MFHAELFSSSIATGATTFAQVSYVTGILTPLNNGVQVSTTLPALHSILGVSANLDMVRAQANSMLPFPYINMAPNNRGTAFESPPRIHDFSSWPLYLKPTEELDIYATQDSGSNQTVYILAQFCDGPPTALPVSVNPPGMPAAPTTPGRFFTVHWTASTTLTAGAFTKITPVFDQALYAGYYALVGAAAKSASGLFFRMFPSFGPLWRPGGAMVQSYDGMNPRNQRYMNSFADTPGGWGVWLNFYQNTPPQVEIFATSADTSEEGWMDLVYLGPQVQQGL